MAISTQPTPIVSSPTGLSRATSRWTLWRAALSGLLLIGAFPHLDWGWLAWFALIPFLTTFPHRRLRFAFTHGAILGLVFFGGLLYWIAVFAAHAAGPALGGIAWVGAAVALGMSLAVFAAGCQALARTGNPWAWRLGVPALWTLLEWGRQFGILGAGWGDLAYTQYRALPLLQQTKLTGVWGLSFLIVLINVALAEWVCALFHRGWTWTAGLGRTARLGTSSPCVGGLVAVILFLAALVFGVWTLRTERLQPTFVAAALQGDIDQNVMVTPAYVQRVMETFGRQGREAAMGGARLTVWPETAIPGYLRDDAFFRQAIIADAVANRQAMIVGARERDDASGKDRNAVFLVTLQGQITQSYAKQKLVPFGEYVPLRAQFPILEKLHLTIYDMAPGSGRQPLMEAGTPVGKVGAAVCYDSTYGQITRDQVARGANVLIVATDDTWFGRTAAARQHAAMSAVRAAETDRYLVRAAATGISQVIAPTGQVLSEAGLFRQAVVSAPIESRATRTLYVRAGDWFVAVCAALFAVLWGVSVRGRRA
ncbi:MAG: apolipoprotein N-acyltransferase [Armatimonadota bacterium]|nr:apolipoprotein N-acyltransferase [Armatimonadota bacterium]